MQDCRSFCIPCPAVRLQKGWRFGEIPHRSDFYGLCASVPGVDHISSLRVIRLEERSGAIAAGNFLIYSGITQHHGYATRVSGKLP